MGWLGWWVGVYWVGAVCPCVCYSVWAWPWLHCRLSAFFLPSSSSSFSFFTLGSWSSTCICNIPIFSSVASCPGLEIFVLLDVFLFCSLRISLGFRGRFSFGVLVSDNREGGTEEGNG
ncbi:hypothetical protein P154DRAFT_56289 [Amniculicola lignicola CBS 123094]|uniref:Uncharacterized protein n=1 Tax=Amniculicola lignicola CBS 123094 TaxID=1392246 RepID=A0A6A5WUC1_9PLEO|nr:hypothetical protein P154DRAFT_56289 [Amniculicola lignicola CBS 123094]